MHTTKLALALALVSPSLLSTSGCATTQPVMEQADDTAITARVGRRLVADPVVKRFDIDVDTIQGVVVLRGKVETATIKASAEKIARDTDGVVSVKNELIVDETPRDAGDKNDDLAIKSAIGRALMADDDVRRVNIDVDVVDGAVTLSGIVHNPNERQEAERIAAGCEHVRSVKNDLTVEQNQPGNPEKLGKIDDDGDRK